MGILTIVLVGLLEAGAAVWVLRVRGNPAGQSNAVDIEKLSGAIDQVKTLGTKFQELYTTMIDIDALRATAKALKIVRDALKTERGRITITQAELETVESRLRELEEIERELEASGIETKEELNILQKKQKDLDGKNQVLKEQISLSVQQMDTLLSELELSTQLSEQVQGMKTELLQTQEKIDILLMQIEQGNDSYFQMKKRYDALDIEYAQLFEKFSAAEEAAKKE